MKESSKDAIKILIILLGVFLALFSLSGFLSDVSIVKNTLNIGTMGSLSYDFVSDSSISMTYIEKGSVAAKAGLRIGDTIIRINNTRLDQKNYFDRDIWGPGEVGYKLDMSVIRNNKPVQITVIKAPASFQIKLISISLQLILPFLMLIYCCVGLWIVIKNSFSVEIASIAIVCFTIGILMFTLVDTGYTQTAFLKSIKFFEIKSSLTSFIFLIPSFWILLFMRFPEQTNYYRKHKIFITILIFFLPVTTLILNFIPADNDALNEVRKLMTYGTLIYIFVGMTIGILILNANSKRFKDTLRARQFKLILFGVKYGGLALLTGWLMLLLFAMVQELRSNFELLLIGAFIVNSIIGVMIPFSFLNSFLKKKLLETEWAFRNKIRDSGITAGLFFIYLFILFQAGEFVIGQFALSDTSMIVFITILISLTFYPINNKLHLILENKFHPERNVNRNKLKEFTNKLQSIVEINSLLLEFSGWLENNFRISQAITYALVDQKNISIPFSLRNDTVIMKRLNTGSPFFWDELPAEQAEIINEDEKKWACDHNISVSIPMISYGELVGILSIGKKVGHEDYTGEDIENLKECATQTALALQNLQLQLQYIEKKRLDKELNLARTIQSQLLPRSIPKIRGLDLFGRMRPCFEVAGDYFDILPLDENKAILAIADVSGKGAGAAMLMSNLQAAFRSSLKFTRDMRAIVHEINNIIHENTNPGQFITFFAGLWNADDHSFEYINAGHNPPIIIRNDGSIVQLKATGFFLGPIPDSEYNTDRTILEKGDLLAIYTDGIDETFNPEYDQFGLERIIASLKDSKECDSEKICMSIYDRTEEFARGLAHTDDATIIIAKVIE